MANYNSIFVSHGSPMIGVEPGQTGLAWTRIAAEIERPKAIIIASAHWLTDVPAVSTTSQPDTIHDFYGFPAPLYQLQYNPPGDPELAERIALAIGQGGFSVAADPTRGLDHGAWVPLKVMYPEADIPVFQLAIQPRLGPEHHYRIGRVFAPLLEEGYLLIGSGSMTHNLRELRLGSPEGLVIDSYNSDFSTWMNARLMDMDIPALLDYRRQAPAAQRAHPTDEHLLPLFVALGAGGKGAKANRLHAGFTEGGMAMDAYGFTKIGQ